MVEANDGLKQPTETPITEVVSSPIKPQKGDLKPMLDEFIARGNEFRAGVAKQRRILDEIKERDVLRKAERLEQAHRTRRGLEALMAERRKK